jgi:NitT/TauT family transport system ATP-binding protein
MTIYIQLLRERITAILVAHDISEGISMSDRVIVLTKRSGTIKRIYDVNLTCDNRTPFLSRKSPEFVNYFNSIWKDLDLNV